VRFDGKSTGSNLYLRFTCFLSRIFYLVLHSEIDDFGFIISSVSAYFGYTVQGGALEVGKASTDSVVINSVLILMADLVFTQLVMG